VNKQIQALIKLGKMKNSDLERIVAVGSYVVIIDH